jgi:hypothetical protein
VAELIETTVAVISSGAQAIPAYVEVSASASKSTINGFCALLELDDSELALDSEDAGVEEAGSEDDAGSEDADADDAGADDAGSEDAGADDAGSEDAGADDAGALELSAADDLVGDFLLSLPPQATKVVDSKATNKIFFNILNS